MINLFCIKYYIYIINKNIDIIKMLGNIWDKFFSCVLYCVFNCGLSENNMMFLKYVNLWLVILLV